MEITGRLILDARTNQLKDGRKVVNFCVAVNDSYKPKDSEEIKKISTLYNCSYWVSPSIGQYLTKGTLVELFGRLSANAWNNAEGEAKASLNFHVNNIKLHGGSKKSANSNSADTTSVAVEQSESADNEDLPF